MIIYIDMDGVLADYARHVSEGHDPNAVGFFEALPPIPGAVEAFQWLAARCEVFILSTAPWSKPHAWQEKRLWVEKHLGDAAFKRLILTHRKDLLRGDVLIDDRTTNGAGEFWGELIQFDVPDWPTTLKHIESSYPETFQSAGRRL